MKIFTNADKTGELSNGGQIPFTSAGTLTYWVEGRSPGQTLIHCAVYSNPATARFMCRDVVSVTVVGLRFLGDNSAPKALYGAAAALEVSEMVTVRLTNAAADGTFPTPLVFDAAPTGDPDNFRVEVVGLAPSSNVQVNIAVMIPGLQATQRSDAQYPMVSGISGGASAFRTNFIRLVSNGIDDGVGGIHTRLVRLDNPPVTATEAYSADYVVATLRIGGSVFASRSLPVFRPPSESGDNAIRTVSLRMFGLPGQPWPYAQAVTWVNEDLAQVGFRAAAASTMNLAPVKNAFLIAVPTSITTVASSGTLVGQIENVDISVDFTAGTPIDAFVNDVAATINGRTAAQGGFLAEVFPVPTVGATVFLIVTNRRELPFRANITQDFSIVGTPPASLGWSLFPVAAQPTDATSWDMWVLCLNYAGWDPSAVDVFILDVDWVTPTALGKSYQPTPTPDPRANVVILGRCAMGMAPVIMGPGAPVYTPGLNWHIFGHEMWHVLAAGAQPHLPANDLFHSTDARNLVMSLQTIPTAEVVHVTEPDPLAAKRLVFAQGLDARADTGTTPPPQPWLHRLLWQK